MAAIEMMAHPEFSTESGWDIDADMQELTEEQRSYGVERGDPRFNSQAGGLLNAKLNRALARKLATPTKGDASSVGVSPAVVCRPSQLLCIFAVPACCNQHCGQKQQPNNLWLFCTQAPDSDHGFESCKAATSKETSIATASSLRLRDPESPPLVRWEVGSLEYNRVVLVVGIGSTHKARWGSHTRTLARTLIGRGVDRCCAQMSARARELRDRLSKHEESLSQEIKEQVA